MDDLSLSIHRGEFFVLVGPSGCGKTTTLRILAGLESPTSGEVLLEGASLNRVRPRHRNVAMVFQEHTLYPHMRVGENLGFSLKMHGLDRKEIHERVREMAEVLGLQERLEHWPRQLSGGEAQRVALGKALIRRPALLLLDEPLSNLDPPLRRKLREEIRRLQRLYSITTLHVTHDQEEAMALGGRMGIMHEGRLMETGSPKEIYDEPTSLFGASFLGSPPINLIPAMLLPSAGGLSWPLAEETVCLPQGCPGNFSRKGREVWAAIRPEHILVSARSKSPPEVMGVVEFVQDMGFEHHLLVTCRGSSLRVRCSRLPDGVHEGALVYLKIRTEALLLFGRDTEGRVLLEESSPSS